MTGLDVVSPPPVVAVVVVVAGAVRRSSRGVVSFHTLEYRPASTESSAQPNC